MGYYCTVPQCTSLAGKTKNVKFHRFPRDLLMADKWNEILKRGKPYTKYSKVCSLHFTQADYNVTTMGQWKTLSKDAVPSQNLPKLHPDGTVMVIRKSRTVKYRDGKKEECDESKKWQMPLAHQPLPLSSTPDVTMQEQDNSVLAYRLQTLGHMTNLPQPLPQTIKPKKQDAIMQTDPVLNEDDDTQPNNSYSEVSEKSYSSEVDPYGYAKEESGYAKDGTSYAKDGTGYEKEGESFVKDGAGYPKDGNYQKEYKDYQKDGFSKDDGGYQKEGNASYSKDGSFQKDVSGSYQKDGSSGSYQKDTYKAKDYTKSSEDYIPQTNEEYNKEAEKYALERKSHSNGYDLKDLYQKQVLDSYQKLPDVYYDKTYMREPNPYMYQNGYPDSAELLRNQQHNLQLLHERQDQHRMETQSFFNENHIKQEIDITDDDKYLYERTKEQLDANQYNERRMQQQRLLDHIQQSVVKQEPENGGDSVMQPQGSPYPCYPTSHSNMPGSSTDPYRYQSEASPRGWLNSKFKAFISVVSHAGYYDPLPRPGPELLIAKQNALAAHTQLWQNTMKRPFFYSETPHYNGPQLLHRYEDLSRILQ